MRKSKVRLVCISDTHNAAPGEGYTLPKGDILIHAGDLTNQGSYGEIQKAINWLKTANFPIKIIVAVVSLPEKGVSLRLFGSPYSPKRGDQAWAFQYDEVKDGNSLWTAIPDDVDVVITHTPPHGYCDASRHWTQGGCAELANALERVKPVLHICGRCHEGRGVQIIRWDNNVDEKEESLQWADPGKGNKKQSLLDLTSDSFEELFKRRVTTAVVNSSIMARSHGHGTKEFNKPIVVDIMAPPLGHD